jgi:hypothetical protein
LSSSENQNSPSDKESKGNQRTGGQKSRRAIVEDEEQRRVELLHDIQRIDCWINAAADNGLFCEIKKLKEKENLAKVESKPKPEAESSLNGPDDEFESIQEHLYNAREMLDKDDLALAERRTSSALHEYDKILYMTTFWWRFSNIYAGPIWIYLVGFLVAVLSFYIYFIDRYFVNILGLEQAAVHAATWGCIGGILRGMWYLKDKVSDRKYRKTWTIYFLSVPFLGGIFGAIIYLVIFAGVVALDIETGPPLSNQTGVSQSNVTDGIQAGESLNVANPLAIIPFAALAGFNWEWAVILFKRIGDTFTQGESRTEQKIEK